MFRAFRNNTMLALDTIRAHKLRSLLTMLGVIIGTGTIIAVGAILTGFDGAVTNVFKSFGPNAVIVSREPAFRTTDLTPEERARKQLTYDDVVALRNECSACERVSALSFPNHGPIVTKYKGNAVYQTQLRGVEESFAQTGQIDMEEGRFFSEYESLHHAPVAAIGADVKKGLFGMENPIGKVITVDGQQFQVIGTMRRPTASFFDSSDQRIFVPFFSFKKMYPNFQDLAVSITASNGHLPQALDQIRTILRIQRHVPPNKPDNFSIQTAEQMVEQFRQITAMTFLVMIVLSSIGLLVGGIGVMNIMLVSVTERTREIGVRKAIGARRADITVQFLLEASVLTGLGGIVGLLLGWMISGLAKMAFSSLPITVPAWAAIAGIVVSVGVGLFFGIWPANKAAKLDPVQALRYE
ncbi:MAG TPA: ABC transporter permease [Bryobacteraceae bacterium]|jgi:putative ABC transport system permease protein|nr:ABC transporter permease [Bryobacteraceae bacterium]